MRRELRIAPLFIAASAVLVPWTVYLGRMLPSEHESAHWNVAWVGFDLALAAALSLVGISLVRRSAWLEGTATAAASLLLVDAWFDVLTSHTPAERTVAGVEAGLVEVPLALVCLWLARSAKRRLQNSSLSTASARTAATEDRREPLIRVQPL
jgi:hypothetical protein